MARRVKWTQGAADNLEGIADYIAEDVPSAARRFVRQILDAAHSLDELAERGRRVPELEPADFRELLPGNYRIIYRIEPEAVFIVAVVQGSRDLTALWERRTRSR